MEDIVEAINKGDVDCINRILKSKKVDVNAFIECEDSRQISLLMLAANKGHAKILHALLEAGAEVNARDHHVYAIEGRRRTPLHYACEAGNVECVKVLLQAGAAINATDSEGKTPLTKAAFRGNLDIVEELIRSGANLNAKQKNPSFTPLTMAIRHDHFELARRLIAAGADFNQPESGNITPLHCAAHKNNFGIVKTLVSVGAQVNIKDGGGFTPLMCACTIPVGTRPTDIRVIKCLLKAGAKVSGAVAIAKRSLRNTETEIKRSTFKKIITLLSNRKKRFGFAKLRNSRKSKRVID